MKIEQIENESEFYSNLSDNKKKRFDKVIRTLSRLINKGWNNWIEFSEYPMENYGSNMGTILRSLSKDRKEYQVLINLDKEFWELYNNQNNYETNSNGGLSFTNSSIEKFISKAKEIKEELEDLKYE